jgi:hypothetical protein
MVERARFIPPVLTVSDTHEDFFWADHGFPSDRKTVRQALSGRQRTVSEGHAFSKLKRKTHEDIGGDFRTDKILPLSTPFRTTSRYGNYWFEGHLLASTEFYDVLAKEKETHWERDGPHASSGDLDEYGTTLISRCLPTNPVSNAASFLGELREGLPSIPGRALLREGIKPKSIGGEYLNVEFGIKPMLSDLEKFVQANQNSEKILAQLERDSGQVVRRRKGLPQINTETTTVQDKTYPSAVGGGFNAYHVNLGVTTRTVKTTRDVWFSGAFTYYLPPKGTWERTISELDKLYGVRLTADTLYQLTPWSWAVDYAVNLGDVIHNLTQFAQDGLVMRYGYVMCKTRREVTTTWNGNFRDSGGNFRPITVTDKYVWETKQRRRATPYGFGLTYDGLSDSQKAIIAALGMSRFGK